MNGLVTRSFRAIGTSVGLLHRAISVCVGTVANRGILVVAISCFGVVEVISIMTSLSSVLVRIGPVIESTIAIAL